MSIQDEPPELKHASNKINFTPTRDEKEALRNAHEIKENVVNLAQNLKEAGRERIQEAAEYVHERVDDLKATGAETLESVETRIRSNPGRSLALAFAVGALASYLLGRRSA